jgi:hypothetical protein
MYVDDEKGARDIPSLMLDDIEWALRRIPGPEGGSQIQLMDDTQDKSMTVEHPSQQ